MKNKASITKKIEYKTIHDLLENLKIARRNADYTKDNFKDSPKTVIKNSNCIFDILEKLKSNI